MPVNTNRSQGRSSKLGLLKELYEAGISYSTIFPEIEGICNEIAFRYSSAFFGEDNFPWTNPRNFSQNVGGQVRVIFGPNDIQEQEEKYDEK